MTKLAILAILAASAHAGTYTCSLQIGSTVITPVTTPTSCSASSGGISTGAGPGSLGAGGFSFTQNLFATASMVDAITISGLTGTGTFIYHVFSNCPTAVGSCIGDGPGWRVVPFTYDSPIPITLSLSNADSTAHPPASLGVTIQIDAATVLRPGINPLLAGSPEFFRGDYSVPGAFVSSGRWNYQFVEAPVPEPATFALAGLALLAVLGMRGRRTIHSGRQ